MGSAIQSAARAEVTQREIQARSEAVQSSQSSIKRLIVESEHQTATVQQLVERYNLLMSQQLFAAVNNEIAPQITAIDRGTEIDIATNIESSIAANEELIWDVISMKNRAFVDPLYLNEVAAVSFVHEPPIRYPPADVWQALSARRLTSFASIL